MSTYTVNIPWCPKPKASIRLGVQHFYNPNARGMKATREHVRLEMIKRGIPMLHGPLFVIAHFRMPIPLSLPHAKRMEQHNLPHIKRPDGDNLEKFLNDALNGVPHATNYLLYTIPRPRPITCDYS